MSSKRQVFVASSNTVPAPHWEVESGVTVLVVSFGNGLASSIEDIVLSKVPSITTAPPIIAKTTKNPATMRIFFLFVLEDIFSIFSLDNLSRVSFTIFSFTSGFFISLPQSRQNLEFTGIDFPHFQQ